MPKRSRGRNKGRALMSDTRGARSPMCPWCGDEANDTPDQIQFCDDVCETTCGGCDQPIIIRRVVTLTYTCTARTTEHDDESPDAHTT